MKSITYGEGIRQEPLLLRQAEGLAPRLDRMFGRYAPEVEVEWDAGCEGGRRWVSLAFRDPFGEESVRFKPEDFTDEPQMRILLNGLWVALLRHRSHYHLERLLQDVREGA